MVEVTVQDLMSQSGVAFGTSGARGKVTAMTDRVCYGYTLGFLSYLAEIGEFPAGGRVALAGDLRPSTPRILGACAAAVRAAGGVPVFCGFVPTPALAFYAFGEGIPSLMVTGSHIPADRNGIKFYRPRCEMLKSDEAGMTRQALPFDEALFSDDGSFGLAEPLPALTCVEDAYVQRYVGYFGAGALTGKRIGVYQHSAVGRDLAARIVRELGADTTLLGRSEVFVPVDTEAIRPEDIALAEGWGQSGQFDAIISTDGDSDRPLLADEDGKWLRGDVLGILCAIRIGATSLVTPVSSNTALERSGQFPVCRRTKIGSPYVVAAMAEELASGSACVCGYEANGGFLLGSAVVGAHGAILGPLPTRDAMLPILAVLTDPAKSVSTQLAALPQRFTYSDRIAPFPQEASKRLFAHLLAGDAASQLVLQAHLFGAFAGAAEVLDLTDGIRTTFSSGVIVHWRASGNAPELRCYTEADSEAAAKEINRLAMDVVKTMPGISTQR